MKRVTQFDIYLLGTVRSLMGIKVGDRIADFREEIILSYISLNSFCNDELNQQLLPAAIIEAKNLRACVGMLDSLMGARPTEGGTLGTILDGTHTILSRSIIAFETALKSDLNNLPTYIIEKVGIYDTDDLLSKADNAFASDLKPLIPAKALEDFKRAGACLAFELYTASGFHGFRAADATLRAYCVHFTGSLPTSQRDWGTFIRAVRGVPAGSARMPNLRTIELIDRVRAEDRNPLIHPETDLDAKGASIAFDLCRTAIVLMATDIKNAP